MKKQLLAGTALVAATMLVAGGAMAQDKKMMKPSISVNGYFRRAVVGGILDEDMGADTPVDRYQDRRGDPLQRPTLRSTTA